MMATSFSAAVGAWASQTEKRLTAVRRRSVELLGEEMARTRDDGGRVPRDTGNLARSLTASTQSMPKTAEAPFAGSDIGSVTATLDLRQPIWLGYQAIYARRQNYGFVGADVLGRVYNQPGSYFVEGAIANWQQIVAQAVAEVSGGKG